MEANPVDTEYARGFHWGRGNSKVEEFGEADCPECGKHYIKKAWNQRFCTVACRNKADLARWKQRTAKRREQRKAKPQPEWVPCPGLDCQNIFLKESHHRKYCSRKCSRHTAYYLRERKTPSFKTCGRCERTFAPKRRDSTYCSHECARAAEYERRAEQRPYHGIGETFECGVCGAEYVKKVPVHKYCSKKCANKSKLEQRKAWAKTPEGRAAHLRAQKKWRQKNPGYGYRKQKLLRQRARDAKPRRPCEHCGEPFLPHKRIQTACSKACRNKLRYARRPATLSCVVCGTEFTPVSIRHKTCSPKCSNAHQARRKRERNKQ